MPYEKNLCVKHLKVKSSETVPVDTLNANKVLYGEDSGKIFLVPTLASNITVTLPSAEVGRVLKIVANPTALAAATANLNANVTCYVKNSGEYIVGSLLTVNSTSGAASTSVVAKNGTSDAQVGLTNNALTSATINLVCTSKGLWTVTGLAADASNSAFL